MLNRLNFNKKITSSTYYGEKIVFLDMICNNRSNLKNMEDGLYKMIRLDLE